MVAGSLVEVAIDDHGGDEDYGFAADCILHEDGNVFSSPSTWSWSGPIRQFGSHDLG